MKYIRSLDELDVELDEAARLAQVSDADFRNKLGGFCLALDLNQSKFADPLSEAY